MRSLLIAALLPFAAACASEAPEASAAETASVAPQPAPSVEPAAAPTPQAAPASKDSGLYALQATSLEGELADLSGYAGKVTLVVNVASACGYTPQYEGLQALHAEFADQGFAVLGFPSNEFGGQEPGSAEEIRSFCSSKFGVTFPMFAKCEVKPGDGQSPVYGFLEAQTEKTPNWNFCKYLVGKDGQVIAFYPSRVGPDSPELRKAIEDAIG